MPWRPPANSKCTAPNLPDFSASPPWETVVESLVSDHGDESLDAYQFVFGSQRVKASRELADYARDVFPAGRPLLEAVSDLMQKINRDFSFDNKATEVTTPVQSFFQKRRGVCQDFAHLQIACLRSLGLPARYISGYLRTLPRPGLPRMVGADASHAWCSAWCPGSGWVDFDPTNNCVPTDGHITVAWGRDYSDVSPVHGVLLGGAKHTLGRVSRCGPAAIAIENLPRGIRLRNRWSRGPELNRRPADYESAALPAELPRLEKACWKQAKLFHRI